MGGGTGAGHVPDTDTQLRTLDSDNTIWISMDSIFVYLDPTQTFKIIVISSKKKKDFKYCGKLDGAEKCQPVHHRTFCVLLHSVFLSLWYKNSTGPFRLYRTFLCGILFSINCSQ